MNVNHAPFFKDCYVMQRGDVERFADALADGFSQYELFKYACRGKYDRRRMSHFWAFNIVLNSPDAFCIADSKEVNSVLIYIPPRSKEPGLLSNLKAGVVRMAFKTGMRRSILLSRFDAEAQKVAQRYKGADDGYLFAFATRLDKQGQSYGKPLMNALLRYLDATGQGCYLETLKPENVKLYEHFSFQLKEETVIKTGNLTLFAMYRPKNK
ncbi:MAG: hypothetical protein J6Q73_08600 [Bacteroidaceae bacterium]|nr:hypothetical protein [Bacteroidaceae bacterium]